MRTLTIITTALVAALCLGLPSIAQAATYTATLTGVDNATGLAVIDLPDDATIDFSILLSGFDAAATAELSNGALTIDLAPVFVNGSAWGSVASTDAAAVAATPTAFTVTVGNGQATLSGALTMGASAAQISYFPVAAAAPGLGGSVWKTDARFVNLSGGPATVTLAYYESSAGGATAPTATANLSIANGTEAVLDDIVANQLGLSNSQGAIVISSDRELASYARIYNDQGAAGTFGQMASAVSEGLNSGALAFLSNKPQASLEGYRANIGWFNPSSTEVSVSFTAFNAADGSQLGAATLGVPGMSQLQRSVTHADLFPSLTDQDDFIVTFNVAGGGELIVYASIVDNVNGDAVYVAATPID